MITVQQRCGKTKTKMHHDLCDQIAMLTLMNQIMLVSLYAGQPVFCDL